MFLRPRSPGTPTLSAAILLLLLLPMPAAPATELPDLVAHIKSSVVAIGTLQQTRRPPARYLGTGFAVGDGLRVVTNYHVIPKRLDEAHKERLTVFSGQGREVRARSARILARDPVHDLALLQIGGEPLPALKLADGEPVREGETIAFTGFPLGMVLGLYPVTHTGIVSAITPIAIPARNSRELTARQIRALRDPWKVLQLDATAYPGNSGSPVYRLSDGAVVGIVNSVLVKGTKENVLKDPSAITYAIPVRYLKVLLEKP